MPCTAVQTTKPNVIDIAHALPGFAVASVVKEALEIRKTHEVMLPDGVASQLVDMIPNRILMQSIRKCLTQWTPRASTVSLYLQCSAEEFLKGNDPEAASPYKKALVQEPAAPEAAPPPPTPPLVGDEEGTDAPPLVGDEEGTYAPPPTPPLVGDEEGTYAPPPTPPPCGDEEEGTDAPPLIGDEEGTDAPPLVGDEEHPDIVMNDNNKHPDDDQALCWADASDDVVGRPSVTVTGEGKLKLQACIDEFESYRDSLLPVQDEGTELVNAAGSGGPWCTEDVDMYVALVATSEEFTEVVSKKKPKRVHADRSRMMSTRSKEECDRFKKQGRCLNCGKKGHTKHTCTEPMVNMTSVSRAEYMKRRGLCLKCKEHGHRANECPN